MKSAEVGKLTPLENLTMFMAMSIRNDLEGFHCAYLDDTQMKELNIIIRNSIIKALVHNEIVTSRIEKGIIQDVLYELYGLTLFSVPDYWERPNEEKARTQLLQTEKVLTKHKKNLLSNKRNLKECDLCDTTKDSVRLIFDHESITDGHYCTECIPEEVLNHDAP